MVAVDVGGTNIRAALMDEQLNILHKTTAMTADYTLAEEFLCRIASMVEEVDPDRKAKCIGMALPAPWKKGQRKIMDITNIPCLEGIEISEIERCFPDYRVYLENDVNVIALLEAHSGAAKGYENSLYITVSTGISAGIIINHHIYHGAHGYAGEIGSVIIESTALQETVQTLEGKCSGLALDRESRRIFGNGGTKELFERYECGDENAKAIIGDWICDMTSGIASVIQTLDPEIIVFGGPVILKHDWTLQAFEKEIKRKVLGEMAENIHLVRAEYGLDAGLTGAGYCALHMWENE